MSNGEYERSHPFRDSIWRELLYLSLSLYIYIYIWFALLIQAYKYTHHKAFTDLRGYSRYFPQMILLLDTWTTQVISFEIHVQIFPCAFFGTRICGTEVFGSSDWCILIFFFDWPTLGRVSNLTRFCNLAVEAPLFRSSGTHGEIRLTTSLVLPNILANRWWSQLYKKGLFFMNKLGSSAQGLGEGLDAPSDFWNTSTIWDEVHHQSSSHLVQADFLWFTFCSSSNHPK